MWEKLKIGEQLPKSKYKGITSSLFVRKYIRWNAKMMKKGKLEYSYHQTERAAAKRYDMYLIRVGRETVNILKQKN